VAALTGAACGVVLAVIACSEDASGTTKAKGCAAARSGNATR
jgi:hypothetical protein